ncbi:sorting nexin-31-like isoform X1 [Mobula birostris]|uniref:sorting nexin-31-like isoform X1 n=1 Tax=Mobula birostris TaxID=1983395 RepID=UPI003B28B61E
MNYTVPEIPSPDTAPLSLASLTEHLALVSLAVRAEMQFTIGDTEERYDFLGARYVFRLFSPHVCQVYGIHLEGSLLCKMRYSQLHKWNEKLKRYFGKNRVPDFPPKNYLAQTESMAEERRLKLQEYLQKVGEDPVLSASEIFTTLLKKAQQETFKIHPQDIHLEILLADATKLLIDTNTCDSAERMLAIAAQKIELPRHLLEYFTLYLVCEHAEGGYSVLRKLHAFELPYVKLWRRQNGNSRVMIRKSYLDPLKDRLLMGSIAGVLLLYSQATYELARGWVKPTPDQTRKLKAFQEAAQKREFLELMREVKFYGHLQFEACTCDYPEPNCPATVRVGNHEINCCVRLPKNHIEELSFKINRIRCWQIGIQIPQEEETELKPELSFEFQDSHDSWRWVTICTHQAFLLGSCIKEISAHQPKLSGNHAEMQLESVVLDYKPKPRSAQTTMSKHSGTAEQNQYKAVIGKCDASVFDDIADDQL